MPQAVAAISQDKTRLRVKSCLFRFTITFQTAITSTSFSSNITNLTKLKFFHGQNVRVTGWSITLASGHHRIWISARFAPEPEVGTGHPKFFLVSEFLSGHRPPPRKFWGDQLQHPSLEGFCHLAKFGGSQYNGSPCKMQSSRGFTDIKTFF